MMPVDTLTALGCALIKEDPAAIDMLHLHLSHDPGALARLREHGKNKAHEINPSLSEDEAISVSDAAIKRWAAPQCRTCSGRRYEAIRGTPMLSSRHCPACNGTGIARVGGKNAEIIRSIISWLQTVESEIAYKVRKKIANC